MGLRLPVLLPARLGEVVGVVLGEDRHALGTVGAQHVGDVEAERGVPARVGADEVAVDPDTRLVVHGPEVEEDAAAARPAVRAPLRRALGHRRRLELALVPARGVVARVADATARGLRREGNLDHVRPRLRTIDVGRNVVALGVVEAEPPGAVERVPAGAAELGAGVRHRRGGALVEGRPRGSC